MWRFKNVFRILVGKLKRRYYLGELDVGGKIILDSFGIL
jgi:hypothetical protein